MSSEHPESPKLREGQTETAGRKTCITAGEHSSTCSSYVTVLQHMLIIYPSGLGGRFLSRDAGSIQDIEEYEETRQSSPGPSCFLGYALQTQHQQS